MFCDSVKSCARVRENCTLHIVLGTIRSLVDPTVISAMRFHRRRSYDDLTKKLALLRRLRRQYEAHSLPRKFSETNVEQSFNEQLFSQVFDYQTLLSHDSGVYHLHPKKYVSTTGRYNDFSLGYFFPEKSHVFVSAELKGPGANLDRPQGGEYGFITPVEQALNAVKNHTGYEWIIVCNYHELRLYRSNAAKGDVPVVAADLHAITDANDLALLCAHFDRTALLGTLPSMKGELLMALNGQHPARSFDKTAGRYRAVFRFALVAQDDFPLSRLERVLRTALRLASTGNSLFGSNPPPSFSFDLEEGWIIAGSNLASNLWCKVGISALGQFYAAFSLPLINNQQGAKSIEFNELFSMTLFFSKALAIIFDSIDPSHRGGRIGAELFDILGTEIEVPTALVDPLCGSKGTSAKETAMGAEMLYVPNLQAPEPMISELLNELLVFFRAVGRGVGVSVDKLAELLK